MTSEKKKRSQKTVSREGLDPAQMECTGPAMACGARLEEAYAWSTFAPLDGFPGGCKKRCVQEKTQEPTNPPLQPEAPEMIVMTVSTEAESARVPERAAPKHISTCGHQKKEAVTNKPCQGAREQ